MTNIIRVSDNQVFKNKADYLKRYFGTGDIQPATIPRKTPWDIINQSQDIPEGWVIWSPKMFSNDSGYENSICENDTVIVERIPEGVSDYFQSTDIKDFRFKATRVVFTKSENDGWRFKGVFVPDYERTTSQVHVFKRVATDIRIVLNGAPMLEILG